MGQLDQCRTKSALQRQWPIGPQRIMRGQLQQVNTVNTDGSTGATQMQSLYRGDGKRAWKQGADSTNRVYFFYDGEMLLGTSDQNGGLVETE